MYTYKALRQFHRCGKRYCVPCSRAGSGLFKQQLGCSKDIPAGVGACLERKESDEGVRLRYRAVFEKETLSVSIALDGSTRIQGIGLRAED